MSKPSVMFALEQVLGHVSHAQNIKRFAPDRGDIEARFADVTFHDPSGLIERAPLPSAIGGSLRARLEVRAALHGELPDAFVFNTQKPALFCPDLLRSRPSLIGLDVTPVQYDAMAEAYDHKPDGNGPVGKLKHVWNRRLFHAAKRLLPWSEWAGRSLIDDYGVPAERVEVIPPGVDTARWTPSTVARRDGPMRILFVGGNFERKGGQLLLDWYGSSLDAEACELHLVTRDPVAERPGVRVYHGMQNNSDELIALAQSCDLFVLPTTADCFSIASMEAMAAGLPAITTTVGGIADIVEDGVSGRIIPPGDGAALARALSPLVRDPERVTAMGRAARQRIEQRFDARSNVDRMVDAVLSVIEQNARPRAG